MKVTRFRVRKIDQSWYYGPPWYFSSILAIFSLCTMFLSIILNYYVQYLWMLQFGYFSQTRIHPNPGFYYPWEFGRQ